jgi:fibronectin-binding autotransporter adhesin
MQRKGLRNANRKLAVITAAASAAWMTSHVRATQVSTSAVGAAQVSTTATTTEGSFLDLYPTNNGSGATWVALDFNAATLLSPSQIVQTMFNDVVVSFNDTSAFSGTTSNTDTLNFYLATDTTTSDATGGTLRYETNTAVGTPGFGLANPGSTGSFASGTTDFYLGSGLYTYSGSTGTVFTNDLSLTNAAGGTSTYTAEQNYLTTQLNQGGDIRLIITNATPASSNASGAASFLGPTTTVAGAAAPQLTLDFSTQTPGGGTNTSVLAVSGPGTIDSKDVSYNFGRVIVGRAATNMYFLTNTSSVSTDTLLYRHEQPSTPVTNGVYPISIATVGAEPLQPVGNPTNTATVSVGFASTDTTINTAGYTISGTAYYGNVSNSGDTPITIGAVAHVVTERFVDDWSSTSTSANAVVPSIYATSPPSIGNILTGSGITDNFATVIGTDNGAANGLGAMGGNDFSTNSLTKLTILGGKTDTAFGITQAYGTGSSPTTVIGYISAATPSFNQTFTNTETAVAYAVVTALKSGVFLDGHTLAVSPTSTVTFSPNYGSLSSTTGGGQSEVGENLTGESDSSRIYASWSAWQAASMSVNNGSALSPGGSATLVNIASNDAIYTKNYVVSGITNSQVTNAGQRAAARVISVGFNQSQWSQSGLTPGVEGVGSVIASTTTSNSAAASATLAFETNDALNGIYGASLAVSLENNLQYASNATTGIYGTQPGDLGTTNWALANTVVDAAGTGAGSYVLTGGTLNVTATVLTGTMNQTGGFSTWGTIAGTGSITNSASALVTGGTTAISSLTGTGTSTISSTGTLTVGAFNQSSLANNGAFNLSGVGTAGSISGTGTTTVSNSASLAVGNFTQGILSNSGAVDMTGSGTVGVISGLGGLTLETGAKLQLAPTAIAGSNSLSTVSSLTLNGAGTLDVTDNSLAIEYPGGVFNGNVEATVRSEIISGRNGGAWTGTGITSSTVATDVATGLSSPYEGYSAVGYADNKDLNNTNIPTQSVLVRFTVMGDSDLNGVVNLSDFDDWLNGFSGTDAPSWYYGDYTYGGTVTLADFDDWLNSFSANFGSLGTLDHAIDVSAGLSSSQKTELLDIVASSVPEPTSLGLLGIAAFGLLQRRRRKT